MAYKIKGVISRIEPVNQITDRFTKQEFILHIDGDYPEDLKFQAINKSIDILNNFSEGEEVEISFDIHGRDFEKDGKMINFTNLNMFRMELTSKPNTQTQMQYENPPLPENEPVDNEGDDLPF